MAEESFLLVSLRENKAKELAQIISNDTCRRILDYLAAKKDSTETEIAKELNIPISTVHYNLQHLTEAKLVNAKEFHYSEKGKEVNHYSLSNKFIIIAPKTWGLKEKLKKLLPVSLIALASAGIIQLVSMGRQGAFAMQRMAAGVETIAEDAVVDKALYAAPAAAEAAPTLFQNMALWFLIGAVFMILVYFIYDLLKK